MCGGRAYDPHMPLVRKGNIGSKAAAAQQQRPIFQARDRAADEFLFWIRHPVIRSFPRKRESGVSIAGTAFLAGFLLWQERTVTEDLCHLRISFAAARTALMMFW